MLRLFCKVAQSAKLREISVIRNLAQGAPQFADARWPQSGNGLRWAHSHQRYLTAHTSDTTSEPKFHHSNFRATQTMHRVISIRQIDAANRSARVEAQLQPG